MEEAKSKGELLVIANLAEQSERYEGKQSMGGGGWGGGVDTPCNDQYGELPPERSTYSGVQVYHERVGIS